MDHLRRYCKCIEGPRPDERDNHTQQPGPLFLPTYPKTPAETIVMNEETITDGKQELIENIESKIRNNAPQRIGRATPSIFRVPKHLRQYDSERGGGCDGGGRDKAYAPLVVPIGPYHQNPPKEEPDYLAIQNYKWQCVWVILSRHRDQTLERRLLSTCLRWLALPEVQEVVKGYYSETISLSENDLAQVLFADACFIIHLLLLQQETNRQNAAKKQDRGKEKVEETISTAESLVSKTSSCCLPLHTTRKNNNVSLPEHGFDNGNILQEMAPLRNNENDHDIHVPLVEGQWTWNLVLYDLLKLENQIPFFVIQTVYNELKIEGDTVKLLDLVLDLFSNIRPKIAQSFKIHDHNKPNLYHLLELFHKSLVHEMINRPQKTGRDKAPERIPRATELKMARFKIRKKEASTFLDVTFKEGVIELPKLQVYDYTDSLFRNLIAFEQCRSGIKPQEAFITLYAVLMDCLIDSSQDAGLLNSKGIIVSRLDSNETLASVFNNLCKNVHYKIQGSYMEDLFVDVNDHYESQIKKTGTTLKRNYCANRWQILSVSAATVLLFLTIVQAVFAVLSFFIKHN